jgi:hypothetical protein
MPPPEASEGIVPPPAQGSTARVWAVHVDEKAEVSEVVEKPLRAPRPETNQSKPLDYWEKRGGTHDQPTTRTRHRVSPRTALFAPQLSNGLPFEDGPDYFLLAVTKPSTLKYPDGRDRTQVTDN